MCTRWGPGGAATSRGAGDVQDLGRRVGHAGPECGLAWGRVQWVGTGECVLGCVRTRTAQVGLHGQRGSSLCVWQQHSFAAAVVPAAASRVPAVAAGLALGSAARGLHLLVVDGGSIVLLHQCTRAHGAVGWCVTGGAAEGCAATVTLPIACILPAAPFLAKARQCSCYLGFRVF